MDVEANELLISTRRERRWLTVVGLLTGVVVVALGIYLALAVGHVLGPQPGTLMQTSSSPDGKWIVEVYDVSGGAGGHSALLVKARPAGGGVTHEILRLDPLSAYKVQWDPSDLSNWGTLVIEWQSPTSVLIGGIPATVDGQE